VPTSLGAHNARIDRARSLLTKKGRRELGRFSFEGATLLSEALAAGVAIDEIFVTQSVYDATPVLHEAERADVPVYVVDERSLERLSDVQTPSGIVAVAPLKLYGAAQLLETRGVVLALADVNDPGNAGTLLRSAEAFGVRSVLFGNRGAEPHLPKVVRGAMGAIFRLRLGIAGASELRPFLSGWDVTGLAAQAEPLGGLEWGPRSVLVVGNERHGLGPWESLCTRFAAIPMRGAAESLNAGVAGSIALYEATKRSGL
jgi:RNA methyltransferase, TrmH family